MFLLALREQVVMTFFLSHQLGDVGISRFRTIQILPDASLPASTII
jgi:hypothetical protein